MVHCRFVPNSSSKLSIDEFCPPPQDYTHFLYVAAATLSGQGNQIVSDSYDQRSKGSKQKGWYVAVEPFEQGRPDEPSWLVDWIWHTHMLFPAEYEYDCFRYVGSFLDHVVD